MDGDITLRTDLDINPVMQSLNKIKSAVKTAFKGGDVTELSAGLKRVNQDIKKTEAQAMKARAALDALMSGEKVPTSVKELESSIKVFESELRKAQEGLDTLLSGKKTPESVKALEKDLVATEKQIDKVSKDFEKARLEMEKYSSYAGLSPKYSPEARKYAELEAAVNRYGAQWEKLESHLYDVQGKLDTLRQNPELIPEVQEYLAQIHQLESYLERMKTVEAELRQNPQLTEEAKKYAAEIERTEAELERLREEQLRYTQALEYTDTFSKRSQNSMIDGFKKVEHRIARLAKRVLFFSLITLALRHFRKYVASLIKADEGLSASLAQVKGNLATSFGMIWSAVLPAIRAMINWLAKATAYLAAFISWLTGKSFKQGRSAFESANEAAAGVAGNTGKIGKAAKKAAKEAQRLLLPFDQMNVLSKEDADDSDGAGGGGAGGGGGMSGITWPKEMDLTMAKLELFKDLVMAIGAAFLGWKLAKILGPLINIFRTARGLAALGKGPLFIALTAIILGIALLVTGIRDLIKEGPNVNNVCKIIAGALMVVGGAIVLLTGATGIGLLIIAIGALVLAFRHLYNSSKKVRKYVDNAVKSIKKAFKKGFGKGLFEIGKQLILGLLKGMLWVIKKIGSWIKKNVVTPIKKWFKKRFGIHSPAKEMKDIGKDIMLGVLEGITIPIKKIGNWIKEHVLDPLKKAFKGEGDETEFVVETDVREKTPGAIEAVRQAWDTIKTKTVKLTTKLKDETGKALATLKSAWSTIKEKTSTLTTKIKDKTGTALATLKSAWKTIKTKTAQMTAKLVNKVKNGTRTYLVNTWKTIKTKTATLTAKLSSKGAFDWIKGVWSSIYTKTATLSVNLTAWVSGAWNTLATKWNNLKRQHPKLLGSFPSLPYLAQGAVIPANKEFLAVLGDQKSGVNIETPLQTMIDAFNTALKANGVGGSQNINVYLQGDAKQLFKVVRVEANNYTQATGKAAFNI